MKRKKMICMAGILLCAGLLAKTAGMPKPSVVKLKSEAAVDSRKMSAPDSGEEKASHQYAGSDMLRTILNAPLKYQGRAESYDGRLNILTDAAVEVPDVNQVSSVFVEPYAFGQLEIDKITEAFFGDADVYDADVYMQEKKLRRLKAPYVFKQEDIDAWDQTRGTTNKVYGAVVMDDGTCYRYDLEKREELPMSAWMKKVEDLNHLEDACPYSWAEYDGMKALYDWVPDQKSLKKMIGITKKEAQKTADEQAARLNLPGMEISVCEYVIEMDRSYSGVPQKENMTGAGYVFHYTRKVKDIPITYTMGYGGRPEKLDIYVTKDGIDEILLSNLYEIGEVETENLKLLPFADIMDIYEKMLEIRCEEMFADQRGSGDDIGAPVQSCTYRTKKIKLGYTRISDPQSEKDAGLLVPVWDFFGEYEVSRDGIHTVRVNDAEKSFLTIHAVDGTVADRTLGY